MAQDEMNQELVNYLQHQVQTTDDRLKLFVCNPQGVVHPKRLMYRTLERYINDFIHKKSSNRLVIIPGFRGVGKTTLMSQLCKEYKNKVSHSLFISVEDAKHLFDVGITELMYAYTHILGESLEKLKNPILVFLDEIQEDPKWAIALKTLFEKTSNVFFCCSGSAAVVLQSTSDLARRAIFAKLPPMNFTEYETAKNSVALPNFSSAIRQALYFAKDAREVYNQLKSLEPSVNQYWSKVDRKDIAKYLAYGSLPFSFNMPNEAAIYNSISLLIERIIKQDLPVLGNFELNTLGLIPRILFAIAKNDTTSFKELSQRFEINRTTLGNIFDSLEKAELLIKIPAYGSNMTVAKKANKYLFMSPAIRMSYFYITGRENTHATRQGKLLEDSIGSHLYREFILEGKGAIRYDSAQNGADFILQILNQKQILIEVGMGKKSSTQIRNTAKKIISDYNLIISRSQLFVNNENNTVYIPLDYYFLL